jgi:hypothetical protein
VNVRLLEVRREGREEKNWAQCSMLEVTEAPQSRQVGSKLCQELSRVYALPSQWGSIQGLSIADEMRNTPPADYTLQASEQACPYRLVPNPHVNSYNVDKSIPSHGK